MDVDSGALATEESWVNIIYASSLISCLFCCVFYQICKEKKPLASARYSCRSGLTDSVTRGLNPSMLGDQICDLSLVEAEVCGADFD